MDHLYVTKNRLEILKERAKRCCCKYCGGVLSLKSIAFHTFEDARVELYCENCERIEFGIEPEIYQCAKNFVDHLEFNYYSDLPQNNGTYCMNVAKVCEIMAWGYQNIGLLNDRGFTMSVQYQRHVMDQCYILTEDDLEQEQN